MPRSAEPKRPRAARDRFEHDDAAAQRAMLAGRARIAVARRRVDTRDVDPHRQIGGVDRDRDRDGAHRVTAWMIRAAWSSPIASATVRSRHGSGQSRHRAQVRSAL
jgi:hypothetical protein